MASKTLNLSSADAAVAAKLGATMDLTDTIPDGTGAAVSDNEPVQGSTHVPEKPKATFEYPVLDKEGNQRSTVTIHRF